MLPVKPLRLTSILTGLGGNSEQMDVRGCNSFCAAMLHPQADVDGYSRSNKIRTRQHRRKSLCKAEREGFEPSVQFDPHTAFPVPHPPPFCAASSPAV